MSRIKHTPANSAKIREVGEALRDTCGDLDHVLRDVFDDQSLELTDLDPKLIDELDEIVLLCNGCNWWVETIEIENNDDGDQLCTDCTESPDAP